MLYGLGWSRTVFHGHVVYSHIGATGAFGTFVFWLPDLRYAIAIFGNTASTLNSVETLLSSRLIEYRLEVPKYRRIDVSGQLKRERQDLRDKIVNAFDVLYPKRRLPRLPPTQNTTHLAGTNLDLGYGTIQLKETTDPEDAASTVLVATAAASSLALICSWVLYLSSAEVPLEMGAALSVRGQGPLQQRRIAHGQEPSIPLHGAIDV